MSTFNSLGSNYQLADALRALCPHPAASQGWLRDFLAKEYGGEAELLYKGRQAMVRGLQLLNLPAGSVVALTGYTCLAVYSAIQEAGLVPALLDIGPGLDFSEQTLTRALKHTPKIRAVIVQNTLGYASDIRPIESLCAKQGIVLIEDLAHCLGALYPDGRQCGTVGGLTLLSFSQDKVADAVSGGALVLRRPGNTDKAKVAQVPLTRQLRDRVYPLLTWTIRTTYPIGIGRLLHRVLARLGALPRPVTGSAPGLLEELPAWYCAIALRQLRTLPALAAHRRQVAQIYAQALGDSPVSEMRAVLGSASALRYPVLVKNRDHCVRHLAAHGFYLSDIWYDAPVAPRKYQAQTDYVPGSCPQAELVSGQMLNLPTHINLSLRQAARLASLLVAWQKEQA